MEEQNPNSEYGEVERLDFLNPEDLEAMRLIKSHEWVIKESHGDDNLLNLLAIRELLFDKSSTGALQIINEFIRARKNGLGIDPTLEP